MSQSLACPDCGHENEPGQRFCGSCGARLERVCPSCGEPAPPTFKFCGSCGAPLAAAAARPAAAEERKVVSVVFADLAGFTSRAERMDPEDVRAILSPYYARLRLELEAFGGRVEKFIGDAVMGLFGAPVAFGDDPERAVRAAISIRDAIREMNAENPELGLEVRIGVNTGEAIVALGGGVRGEGMVAGDVVNTASRLQSHAPVNCVLVGEETYRCTRSCIEYRATEPVVAKGKERPVPAWLAVEPSAMPGERHAKTSILVGRESELSVLHGIWQRVVAERSPHLVTLLGAPGIGKTRLAADFAAAVEQNGGRRVLGRSLPYGKSGAYAAFGHQVKQVTGIFDSDPPAVARQKLVDTLAALLGSEDAREVAAHLALLIGLAGERDVEERQILFFSGRRLVEELAKQQPTVLMFEDIHCADSALFDLVEHLAGRVREVPLLVLTLARPELLEARPTWGRGAGGYTSLVLEPLDEAHSAELAQRFLGARVNGHAADVAARLAATAEGNPLFIEELAASLSERSGALGDHLPTSVRAIIASRLDGLPPDERAIVLDASVIGRVFWRSALSQLGWETDRTSRLLDSLEERDIVRRDAVSRLRGHHQFSFKHGLVPEVAYATLPRAQRRERHAAVARFLEDVTGDRSEFAAALAYHWREAGEADRAIARFLAAAGQASRSWAKEEAVAFYDRALELVPEDDTRTRRSIRLQRAVAQQAAVHIADAERLRSSGNPG